MHEKGAARSSMNAEKGRPCSSFLHRDQRGVVCIFRQRPDRIRQELHRGRVNQRRQRQFLAEAADDLGKQPRGLK